LEAALLKVEDPARQAAGDKCAQRAQGDANPGQLGDQPASRQQPERRRPGRDDVHEEQRSDDGNEAIPVAVEAPVDVAANDQSDCTQDGWHTRPHGSTSSARPSPGRPLV
jgi:hypothetical protein